MAERAAWTGEIVALLHVNKLTQNDLAEQMGVTKEYISMLLAGTKEVDGMETLMRAAIQEILDSGQKPTKTAKTQVYMRDKKDV